jgi:hypothetical protein
MPDASQKNLSLIGNRIDNRNDDLVRPLEFLLIDDLPTLLTRKASSYIIPTVGFTDPLPYPLLADEIIANTFLEP